MSCYLCGRNEEIAIVAGGAVCYGCSHRQCLCGQYLMNCQHVTACDTCGKLLAFSEHPFCPHGFATVSEYRPFKPFFDVGLGAQITSLAQWNRTMKEKHADLTDSPSKGKLSARLDRCHEDRKERARG